VRAQKARPAGHAEFVKFKVHGSEFNGRSAIPPYFISPCPCASV
jgi:hypothetical protein